jgi:hypothetical protein
LKALFYIGWFVAIFFAVCLAGIALSYFDFDLTRSFLGSKQTMVGNKIWLIAFYLHLLFGAIVTLIAIPLFFSKLIPFKAKLHKRLGKIYIGSILFVSGPTGLYLAFFAEGGQFATIGFILMSMAWMIPTYIAFQRIIKGDIQGHYNWMIRSYAMTLSGVTLRLITPIASRKFDFDYETTFIIGAYIPWIFNLVVGEILVILNKKRFKTLNIAS